MTEYTARVTIIVPAAHIPAANALALVLGESASDDQTFREASWQDATENLYSVASAVVTNNFINRAGNDLEAPAYAPDADLTLAGQAQAILEIWPPADEEDPAPPVPSPDTITAIIHSDASAALAMAGLSRVPVEGE